mgnify:CR=1 FL=1
MGNIAKKAQRRLDARIKFWESLKNKSGFTKPGSLKYKK